MLNYEHSILLSALIALDNANIIVTLQSIVRSGNPHLTLFPDGTASHMGLHYPLRLIYSIRTNFSNTDDNIRFGPDWMY